ncbi:Co2+/Mg2+ efflux protein ApaG [Stappia sp.]|uniref:Co2+/Mg2+ efflux protein ApaG n=1 Tax=Stappia sp. TaxID=1870903 RepID=UPI003C7AA727
MYRAVTHDIQVTVEPFYLVEESDPDTLQYLWAYTVEIVNHGTETVRLRARRWLIVDGAGREEEVRGLGVIGEQPVLGPGERYEYTSGCPLRTPSGMMSGSYEMEDMHGNRFDVAIPPFSLDIPGEARSIN